MILVKSKVPVPEVDQTKFETVVKSAVAVWIWNGKAHRVKSAPALATGNFWKDNTNVLETGIAQGAIEFTVSVNVTDPAAKSVFEGL